MKLEEEHKFLIAIIAIVVLLVLGCLSVGFFFDRLAHLSR